MKSLRQLTLALALVFSLGFAIPVKADRFTDHKETIDLHKGDIYLNPQQMESVSLDGWRHVEKLFINAIGRDGDGSFEVLVNGDVKGTIHVPGRDPMYVVTVNEVASSIQFRHLSGCGSIIQRIQIVQSERSFSSHEYPNWTRCVSSACAGIDFPARNEASGYARRAIHLVDQLQGFADYDQFGEYLLPIKKAGARAYAAAEANGALSLKVRELLLCLKAQIAFARPYVENTFERSNAFELAVELLSLENKLDGVLR